MQKLSNIDKKYENYRWFFTTSGALVVGGKSDEQNEDVLLNFLEPDFIVMHTSEPGSPFMIIQKKNPNNDDLNETAVFCACFSKQWKLNKKLIEIDIFKGDQVFKAKGMKTGTFGVKGNKKTIKVKPKLYLVIQKGRIRAVPNAPKKEILAEILQGNLNKEEAAKLIFKKIKEEHHLPISKEEIMSAIPSDRLEIK